MLLNHPIDYLYCLCVCARCVVQRVTDCQGEPSRYMLMGPCVSKAQYSFIRLYYAKQYTPAAQMWQKHTQIHRTKQEESREHLDPCVSEDEVCFCQTHTLDGDYYQQSGLRQ